MFWRIFFHLALIFSLALALEILLNSVGDRSPCSTVHLTPREEASLETIMEGEDGDVISVRLTGRMFISPADSEASNIGGMYVHQGIEITDFIDDKDENTGGNGAPSCVGCVGVAR